MEDKEAYLALWAAICDAADKLAGRCQIYLSRSPNPKCRIGRGSPAPDKEVWRMVEALSLLMILYRADEVHNRDVVNIFGKTGPLHYIEANQDRYLWAQHILPGDIGYLGAVPDIAITSSPNELSSRTISRIVECKCQRNLGTHEIRGEFGKAFDLKVITYHIWSFYSPSKRIIEGARRLGLNLVPLEFDTARRADLISKPENLQAHISNALETSWREARFAITLAKAGEEASSKVSMIELYRDEKEKS